jgi:hypothetical protein
MSSNVMLLSRISFYTLLVLLLSSCDKNYKDSTPSTADLANSSIVQVYIATVNASRNLFYEVSSLQQVLTGLLYRVAYEVSLLGTPPPQAPSCR